MPTLAVPVQLISSATLDPLNPLENPVQLIQQGDVQISTGGSAFANIATLPTASTENNVDLIVQLSDAEVADDYEIRFHDPDGVWVDFNIDVMLPAVVVDPVVDPVVEPIPPTTEIPCDLTSKTINASCSQIKTHRFVPVNSEGAAIDTQGVGLMFVIEDQAGFDLETGTAFQNPPVGDPLLADGDVGSEVRFTSQAANDVPGEYRFAVRDVVSNSPIGFGVLIVSYVPKAGNPTQTADTKGVCIRIGNQQDGTAIEGATVRVTEDVEGLIQVAAFVTGADGIVDIKVAAAGTYYAHASKAGFAIGGPIEFTVV